MQTKTVVRTDRLNLLIVGIRRAMSMYDGELKVWLDDEKLCMHCVESGGVCEIKLSDNVKIKGQLKSNIKRTIKKIENPDYGKISNRKEVWVYNPPKQ